MEKNLNMLHAEKLYKLRRDSNLKQAIVANAIGKSQQSYSKLERGDVDFSDETVDAICKFFDLSLEDFLNLDTTLNYKESADKYPNKLVKNTNNNNSTTILLQALLDELKSIREERKFFIQLLGKIFDTIENKKVNNLQIINRWFLHRNFKFA